MKTPRILMALALGLGLTFTSCSDSDVTNNSGNTDGDNTEQTDLEWQKQISLQRLLGAFASVDTIPSDWSSTGYIATQDVTIGKAADDATPNSVRLVATSNLEEAWSEYCSYVGKSSSPPPTADTWQLDGIGSLTFTPNNQSDLYATLKVNLKQLPTLQEIRFVPASVIGNNSLNDVDVYYSYGDVIADNDGVFWVCVRPVIPSLGKGQSHWCTFQLTKDNIKTINNNFNLPTGLGKDEAKSQRMVLNLFNLLRFINAPTLCEKEEVKLVNNYGTLTHNDLKNINIHWAQKQEFFGNKTIWQLIELPYYYDKKIDKTFINRFSAYTPNIHVLYYGYTSSFFSSNYKVYDQHLTLGENTSFLVGTPSTPTINSKDSEKHTLNLFTTAPEGKENYKLISSTDQSYNNTFIVKHRTGAQLQGRLFNSMDDSNPDKSFRESAPSKKIDDVFVYKRASKVYE